MITCVHAVCVDESCRTHSVSGSRGRRKGPSPGQPTKHDPVICGRRNVQNMEKVNCYILCSVLIAQLYMYNNMLCVHVFCT